MNSMIVARALIEQVTKAIPKYSASTEADVRTYISRPMWEEFCKEVGIPEGSEPTEWLGIDKTYRIYGSETIILDRKDHVSWSESKL